MSPGTAPILRSEDGVSHGTRWFKYDRDLCGLFTYKSVPVIFEPPCIITGEARHAFGILVEKPLEMHLL
jgi:hypothetical protein